MNRVGPSTLAALTPLRGLAACWVLLAHVDAAVVRLLPPEATGLITKGYLWVDFFFLLSGFIICHSYGERLAGPASQAQVQDYLLARFARLYPLHLFTLGAFAFAAQLFIIARPGLLETDLFGSTLSVPSLFINLLLGQAFGLVRHASWNVLSWSVAAEWWTYVLAVPLLSLLGRGSSRRCAGAAGAAALGLLALSLATGRSGLNLTHDYGFLRCLFAFTLGVSLHALYRSGYAAGLLRRDRALAAAFGLVLLLMHLRAPDLLLIPAFALVILAAASNSGRLSRLLALRPFQYLGEASYSIYMVQGVWLFVLLTAAALAEQAGTPLPAGGGLYLLAGGLIALVLLSAALAHRFVEQPARRNWKARLEEAFPAPAGHPARPVPGTPALPAV